MDLQLSTSRHDGYVVVSVTGDLDLESAPQLHDCAVLAAAEESPRLVLDLGGVTFMDSSGLKCLLSIRRRVEQEGGTLALVAIPYSVRRVLSVTGTEGFFAISERIEDVAGAEAAPAAD